MRPATNSWMMIRRQTPAPMSDGSPYMPVITYTMAWPRVITMPNTGRERENVNGGKRSMRNDEDVNEDDDLASIIDDDVVAKNVDDSNDSNDDSNSIQSLSTQDKSKNLLSEASVFTGKAVPV